MDGRNVGNHVRSLGAFCAILVGNIRCGGNDIRLGFYAAERNG